MKKTYQKPKMRTTKLSGEYMLCGSGTTGGSENIEIPEGEHADGNFEELNLRLNSIWKD